MEIKIQTVGNPEVQVKIRLYKLFVKKVLYVVYVSVVCTFDSNLYVRHLSPARQGRKRKKTAKEKYCNRSSWNDRDRTWCRYTHNIQFHRFIFASNANPYTTRTPTKRRKFLEHIDRSRSRARERVVVSIIWNYLTNTQLVCKYVENIYSIRYL